MRARRNESFPPFLSLRTGRWVVEQACQKDQDDQDKQPVGLRLVRLLAVTQELTVLVNEGRLGKRNVVRVLVMHVC